jgi:hypothetical protein
VTEQDLGSNKSAGERLKTVWDWLGRSVSFRTIIAAGAIVGVAVAIFVAAGGVDVSADAPDSWLAYNLLHFVFKRSESARASGVVPPADIASPSRVRLAAQHFDMVCANCHGRPGFGQSVVALSMSPRPQYLPKVVGQFKDAQLYMRRRSLVDGGVSAPIAQDGRRDLSPDDGAADKRKSAPWQTRRRHEFAPGGCAARLPARR